MNRKTLISLGVIALLLSAVIIQRTVHFSSVPTVKPWDGAADEITIKKGAADEVRIAKKGEKWIVGAEEFPAESSIVDGMERKLKELSFSDLVTKKEFYERFDLSDDRAIRVTVRKKGKILRELLIGKKSTAGESAYVKFPNEKEVYLAGGNLAFEFDRTVDALRSKSLLSATIDTIESISVKYKGDSYTLAHESAPAPAESRDKKTPVPSPEMKWVLKGSPVEADQNKAREFASEFANITAQSFIPEADVKKKTGTPQCEITVKAAGKETSLRIYAKEGKDCYICYSSENPYYVLVGAWKAEKLLKLQKELTNTK
jgi:hypothetical protein